MQKIDNMQASNNKFLERMEEWDKKHEGFMEEMRAENNHRFDELKSAIVNLTNAITAASKDGRQQGSETG